jgi:hypothetical protein
MSIIRFRTSLSQVDCNRIVRNSTTRDILLLSDFSFRHAILCRTTAKGVRLRIHHPWRRNDFARMCYLQFTQGDSGTEITAKFSVHPFTVAFMRIWFGFLIIAGGCIMIGSAAALLGIPGARVTPKQNGPRQFAAARFS